MSFDSLHHPYPSFRGSVFARNGMVATSQPLAAQAGLDMLKRGGNAVDAAIAAAAALTVVEPCSNGVGGDAFALIWTKGRLHGLNASGPSPASISIDAVRAKGHGAMPVFGAIPVSVPGAPSAWGECARRFGRLPLTETLAPAIRYAEEGYPVSPVAAVQWESCFRQYKELRGEEFRPWFDMFAPQGRAPAAGELWRSAELGRTLRLIAETDAEAFYRGELARKTAEFVGKAGGFLTDGDLAGYRPEWVEPIRAAYRGYDVWEIPPNGQGLVALLALNIMNGFDLEGAAPLSEDVCHKQIEAIKLAFADGRHYITDPSRMKMSPQALLAESYGELRRGLIGERAALPEAGNPAGGGTVYIAAADGDGNMVSFIQSNYMKFGSALVVPGTGISLHNRGSDFSLDPEHANRLEPGKKTYHTIIPGFLTRGGKPVGPFGVMGAYMQPQGHLQVLMNAIDFHLHPQAALDVPRWQWLRDLTVAVEPHFPADAARALEQRGHRVQVAADSLAFGRGQIIWRDEASGMLCGGSESRADGLVAAW